MSTMESVLDNILELINKSKFPCCPNASSQVSMKSDSWFGTKCCLINFKMVAFESILDIIMEHFYNFEFLCCLDAS